MKTENSKIKQMNGNKPYPKYTLGALCECGHQHKFHYNGNCCKCECEEFDYVKKKSRYKTENSKMFKDLNDKLTLVLRNSLAKRKGEYAVMSSICLGLSEVCEGLSKIEEKKVQGIENKLKLWKLGRCRLNKKTVKILKSQLKYSKEDYKKYQKKFLANANVFANFSKLLEKEALT